MPKRRDDLVYVTYKEVMENLAVLVDMTEKAAGSDSLVANNRAYRKALTAFGRRLVGAKAHSSRTEKEYLKRRREESAKVDSEIEVETAS